MFVVKFVRVGDTPHDRQQKAQREFQNLTIAHALLRRHQGLTVPRPYRFYPESAAIVSDYFSGPSVTRCLSRATRFILLPSRRVACIRIVEQCANWLNVFHRTQFPRPELAGLSKTQQESLRARLRLAEEGRLISADAVGSLGKRYANIPAEMWANSRIGFTHHDFGPHNILVTPTGICVLDLGDSQPSFVLQDLARFYLELSILQTSPVLSKNRTFIAQLQETFLGTYGESVDVEAMRLVAVKIGLGLLLTASGEAASKWHRRVARYLREQLECHANGRRFCGLP
jgi:tRNA A-37 threonylcarbamoyl transferase component Bud32